MILTALAHTGGHFAPSQGPAEDKVMAEALVTMTQKSFGCLGVVDAKGRLVGMITDGDLRRHMGRDLLTATGVVPPVADTLVQPLPATWTGAGRLRYCG